MSNIKNTINLEETGTEMSASEVLNYIAFDISELARNNGFTHTNMAQSLCLIHSEVSEALECLRTKEGQEVRSEKIEDHTKFAEELADIIIRTLDLASYCGIDIGSAVFDKHAYNKGRPWKHGKRF